MLLIVSVLVMLGIFASTGFASAQTTDQTILISQLQKQIQQLLDQIQALQKEVTELKTESDPQNSIEPSNVSETTSGETQIALQEITRSLSLGSRGNDVIKLQEFLARDKEIYPEGLATGFYGPKTVEAVKTALRASQLMRSFVVVSTRDPKEYDINQIHDMVLYQSKTDIRPAIDKQT